jgi:hypothetical protein
LTDDRGAVNAKLSGSTRDSKRRNEPAASAFVCAVPIDTLI